LVAKPDTSDLSTVTELGNMIKMKVGGQEWWYPLVTPVLWGLRQEDFEV
jgi:hypothetical protein